MAGLVDHLASALAHHRDTQNLVGLGVSDHLDDPSGVTDSAGAGDERHRERVAPTGVARRDCLLFRHADNGDLRIREDSARNDPVVHGARLAIRQSVARRDPSVVASHRGRHLATCLRSDHVPGGEDVGHVRAQVSVDEDLTVPPDRHSDLLDCDVI